MSKVDDLSSNPYASPDTDLFDNFGHIGPLEPKVVARAQRVVRRAAGDHPVDELLDILGIADGDLA